MDCLGNEVTSKIRIAIKNKLSDLGAHVDDELPDYIMVMVANKKPKAQMIEDLSVFLGNKTVAFSNWLHDALEKMNLMATESSTGHVMAEDAEEILSLKDEPELDDPLSRELQEDPLLISALTKHSTKPIQIALPTQNQEHTIRINPSVVSIKPIISTKVEPVKKQEITPPANDTQPEIRKEVKTATVQPSDITDVKPKLDKLNIQQKQQPKPHIPISQVGAIVKRNTEPAFKDDDDDTPKTLFGSVASIVKVTERKSSIQPHLQANSRLLLKAVEEANKSVQVKTAPKKTIPVGPCKPIYNPKPASKSKVTDEDVVMQEDDSVQASDKEIIVYEDDDDDFGEDRDTRLVVQGQSTGSLPKVSPVQLPSVPECIPTTQLATGDHQPMDSSLLLSGRSPMMTNVPRKRKLEESNMSGPKRRENSPEPHFVVTLDGVDPTKFLKSKKLKRSVVEGRGTMSDTSSEVMEELDLDLGSADDKFLNEVEEVESTGHASEEENQDPVKVRCKYWPACKNGAMCEFHHPNVPCTKFPKCKFGNKCLYIHPNCKYDSSCQRPGCPYTHSTKRPIGGGTFPPTLPAPAITSPKTYCKFFPKCFNAACPFYHPSKMCRFGFSCQTTHCPFTHPAYPPRQNLKWVSPARMEISSLPESDSCLQK